MDPRELLDVLKARPFEPFRLHVSDGSTYDVRHPDQVLLTRRACHIGIAGNGKGLFQRIARVATLHITRIEPRQAAGPRPKRR